MPSSYVVNPSTDPNWAWDVPGWQVQTNTGDIQSSLGPSQAGLGGGFLSLSGELAGTMSPESAVTAALTVAANVAYFGLIYVPEGGVTTKYVVNASTATGGTHVYALLGSITSATTGVVLAAGADVQGAIPQGAAASWAASTTLAPGFYMLGMVFGATTPVMWGTLAGNLTIAQNNTVTAALGVNRFMTASLTPGASAPAIGSALTYAKQTTLGGIYASIY